MKRIVASIHTLQQHIATLASNAAIYRPTACPNCSFGKLWCHGCYERKADRQTLSSESLKPIPIPRYLCQGCGRTCSRLPECIAPRRWYNWTIPQAIILMLLSGCSLCGCSRRCGLDRQTVRRWWTELITCSNCFYSLGFQSWGGLSILLVFGVIVYRQCH